MGQSLADQSDAMFCEISAKTGENIVPSMESLAR